MLQRTRRSSLGAPLAMTLFLALSGYWLEVAATARRVVVAGGGGGRSLIPSVVAVCGGVAGDVLVLAALVGTITATTGDSAFSDSALRTKRTLALGLSALVGAVIDLGLAAIVTRDAIASAPKGVYSGEGVAAIAILAVAQVGIVGLALLISQVLQNQTGVSHPRPRVSDWVRSFSTGGMALTCLSFAAWALVSGHGLSVSPTWITGRPFMTNTGAWWPGLFSAMAMLYLIVFFSAPGLPSTADSSRADLPQLPRRKSRRTNLAGHPGG